MAKMLNDGLGVGAGLGDLNLIVKEWLTAEIKQLVAIITIWHNNASSLIVLLISDFYDK